MYVGEKLSADVTEAEVFKDGFNMFMQTVHLHLDNIYNADETGLYYKELPTKTFALSDERQVFGRKPVKQRVTVLVCANATGTHKIPLLVIGTAKNPRCFKNNRQNLPVHYEAQKKGWMNSSIFLNWYKNIFVPEVRKRKPGENERYYLFKLQFLCKTKFYMIKFMFCKIISIML